MESDDWLWPPLQGAAQSRKRRRSSAERVLDYDWEEAGEYMQCTIKPFLKM